MGASRKVLTRFMAGIVGVVLALGAVVGLAGPTHAADEVDVNFTQLLFKYATVNTDYVNVRYSGLVSTAGRNNGDIVLWKSLATINGVTIDAIVTTTLSGMTLSSYGSGTAGATNDFRTNATVTSTTDGYGDFRFQFCKSGTSVVSNPGASGSVSCGTPLTLSNVQVTGLDIDGSGSTSRQYNTFTPVLSDTVTSPTNLIVTRTPADAQPYQVKFLGTTDGTSTNLPQEQAVVSYSSVSDTTIRLGSQGVGGSAAGSAFFALRWKAQAFCLAVSPFTCSATTTSGQSATVNYDINGGSGTTPDSVSGIFGEVKGTVATGAGFSKPGFTFTGWNTSPDGSGSPVAAGSNLTIPSGSTTYYAVWAGTYAITYDGNGATSGSVPPAGSYTTGGTAYTVAANSGALVREDYAFAGWNTQPDGSGTTYAPGSTYALSADLPLYAQWTPTSATLKVKVVSDGPQFGGGRVAQDYDGVEVEIARNGGSFDYRPMQVTDAAGEVDFGSVDVSSSYTVRLKAPCDNRPVETEAPLAVEAGAYTPTFQLAATVPCTPVISSVGPTVSWTEPNDGGSTISYYTLQFNTPARVSAAKAYQMFARYWPSTSPRSVNVSTIPAVKSCLGPDAHPVAPFSAFTAECYFYMAPVLRPVAPNSYPFTVAARNQVDTRAANFPTRVQGWSDTSAPVTVTP